MIEEQGGLEDWDDEQYYSSYDKALRDFLSDHSDDDDYSDYIDLFLLGMDLANVNNENVGENLGEFLYKNSSNVYKYITNLRLCCELNIDEEDYDDDEGKINIYYPNANYAAQPMLIVGDPLKEANRYDIRFVLRENSSTDYDNAYATPGWYEGDPDDTIVTR